MTAGFGGDAPFHNHSPAVPPNRIGPAKSVGVAWSNSMASMKFDFPEAFGPMTTFNGVNSIALPSGPNDRKLFSFRLRRNALIIVVLSLLCCSSHHHRPLLQLRDQVCFLRPQPRLHIRFRPQCA